MKWHIGNLFTRIDADNAEREWLEEYLSYTSKNYIPWKKQYVTKHICLLQKDEFPTGLGVSAYYAAQKDGFVVEIDDQRVKPCDPDPDADLEWLRHHPAVSGQITHQIEAVKAALKFRRGILWMPTGSGKTDAAIGIVKALPCKWLFLVHRADLLQQTADRYEKRAHMKAGIVGDGRWVESEGGFTVCMFQTLYNGLMSTKTETIQLIKEAQGIIVDEAHAVSAMSLYTVAMHAVNAYFRIGLSGTPLAREDDRNMLVVSALGPIIYRIMPEELVKIGLLARPTIRMVEVKQKSARMNWRGVYNESIVGSKKRNDVLVETIQRAEKPCLVFVQHLKHGRQIMKQISKEGINAEFAWGAKSTTMRRSIIASLERGIIDVLVCNVIFQEGVDIPCLRSVVIAAAGKSTIATVQRIGRGMRADVKTGKTGFEVWDFADCGCGCDRGNDHGNETPHCGCKWLERHTKARIKAYKNEGFEVSIEKETTQRELFSNKDIDLSAQVS